MSNSMPEALIKLYCEIKILRAEALELREKGRHALAISLEMEARTVLARLDKSARAYKALGLL